MRPVVFHSKAAEVIREFPKPLRRELGESLLKLQQGLSLGLPHSRPMPNVMQGVHELRLRDDNGIYRVFYYVKSARGIFVFHAFTKRTQKTSDRDTQLAWKRLKEMLNHD